MLISILKSKIQGATITDVLLHYEGSIAVDPALLQAARMIPGEKVHVLNFNNGNRLETYLIRGKKGEVSLRGPAAHLGKKGDRIIILAYGMEEQKKASRIKPKIVWVDEKNRIK